MTWIRVGSFRPVFSNNFIWGPWHILRDGRGVMAICGAGLYRNDDRHTGYHHDEKQPGGRICPKCKKEMRS